LDDIWQTPADGRRKGDRAVADEIAACAPDCGKELWKRSKCATLVGRRDFCNIAISLFSAEMFDWRDKSLVEKGGRTYTTQVLRNRPSPIPFTARPTTNIANVQLLASILAPTPNMNAPIAIPLILPTELARCPPKKDDLAAGMRIVETTSPWIVDESCPKDEANWGIVVRGPMVPVSRPNKRPPIAMRRAEDIYFGG
jgi:hypothetical protein